MHFVSSNVFSDIDECLEDPCDKNATCNNTDGSFLCTCNTGYSGGGESCTGMYTFVCMYTKQHNTTLDG